MLPGSSGLAGLPLLLLLLLVVKDSIARVGAGSMLLLPEAKACRYSRAYDLYQVQCKDLKLVDIPQNLQSSIEVLDARENRIRELRNDSLSRYTSLRYLYLQDNFVQKPAEAAFEPTYYLEALDLSKNGLLQLPKSLFGLGSLRNMYLNHNQLEDASLEVSNVLSPIQRLEVAHNRLSKLPQLSPLPSLTFLNASHNSISRVTAEDLAPLCSLKLLDLTGNKLEFDPNGCECYQLLEWAKLRSIKIVDSMDCLSESLRCGPPSFSNSTLDKFNKCQLWNYNKREALRARTTWKWIALVIGAFVSSVFVALCCMHSRNHDRRQRLKEQEIEKLNAPSANTEQLLTKDPNHDLQS